MRIMNIKYFGFAFIAHFLVLTVSAYAIDDKRPNIVMIVADDHGLDAIGAYGNKVIQTPNLDQLAAEGARFSNAFATVSSCSSSRSVMLTGLQVHANGMFGLQHDIHRFQSFDTVKSLPVMLSQAGYNTARVGKYHLAPDSVYRFDVVLSKGAANDMSSMARSPIEMANVSKGFIEKSDKPFFLYYASDDPHRAFPFITYPEPNKFGNRQEGYPGITPVVYNPDEVIVPPFLPDTKATRLEIAEYYQSVSRLDEGIGHLIKILKETGKYDNTLILYLSDNGIAFPGAKTNLYDPGIRLPLIVRTPGGDKAGELLDHMISWADLTPTILDYAEALGEGSAFHGKSFKAVMEREKVQGWDTVYASHIFHDILMYYPMRMVRNKKYKLLWNIAWKTDYPTPRDLYDSLVWQEIVRTGDSQFGPRSVDQYLHRAEFELYDIEADPNELHNLADDPAFKDVLADMIEELKEFQKNTGDRWIRKWQYQ